MSCDTCDWGRAEALGVVPVIECHRFPPARDKGWPQLQPEEWCGEYRPRVDTSYPSSAA